MNKQPKRPLEPRKRAIVVGASSGIGAALVRHLARQGYLVAALARREEMLIQLCDEINGNIPNSVQAYVHDVTAFTAVPDLFQTILRDLDGLDLIIYVAGAQPAVAATEYDFEKDKTMIDVNLLGGIAWLNQAAARFGQAQGGHIVGIGSIAGDRGRVAGPVYGTSKAAFHTYLEALRNRLTRRGVSVTTIKPGFVDTVLLKNAAKTFWVISPDEAANQIMKAVDQKKQTVYVPARWRLVGLIIQHIPSFIFRRMKI